MIGLEEVSHRHDDSATLKEANRIPAGTPILELKGLQKNYGHVQALKPATLTFLAGEIHAIVGEKRRRQIHPHQIAHRRHHPHGR